MKKYAPNSVCSKKYTKRTAVAAAIWIENGVERRVYSQRVAGETIGSRGKASVTDEKFVHAESSRRLDVYVEYTHALITRAYWCPVRES